MIYHIENANAVAPVHFFVRRIRRQTLRDRYSPEYTVWEFEMQFFGSEFERTVAPSGSLGRPIEIGDHAQKPAGQTHWKV